MPLLSIVQYFHQVHVAQRHLVARVLHNELLQLLEVQVVAVSVLLGLVVLASEFPLQFLRQGRRIAEESVIVSLVHLLNALRGQPICVGSTGLPAFVLCGEVVSELSVLLELPTGLVWRESQLLQDLLLHSVSVVE